MTKRNAIKVEYGSKSTLDVRGRCQVAMLEGKARQGKARQGRESNRYKLLVWFCCKWKAQIEVGEVR